ncbi:phosphate permease [Phanerochaete sordida]|uniref:Phosphate permease n=1 Tax=Phanerochaete sordida TaxID=48140 RepID=A0A9P3LLJ7_9APHY|nr:phosphate permease [Phanerochaete sordida]
MDDLTMEPGKGVDPDARSECTAVELNARRRAALAEVDNAPWSWFHVKILVVTGIGFFTDSYDIFAINIAATMLGYVYGKDQQLSTNQDLGVKVATPVGTIFGQLIFGWLADYVGRKRMYGIELMIIIIGTFGQALAGEAHAVNIIAVIILWRGVMGVGIGGDYPLSTIIPSEFASVKSRGALITAVGAAQGWGAFCGALVGLIITAAYKDALLKNDPNDLTTPDAMWRLLIGLGCVPGAVALYFRLTIPETPRYTMDIERNVKQAADDVDHFLRNGTFVVDPDATIQRVSVPRASWRDFRRYFSRWKNMKTLIGACWSWFAIDISFYGLGLNTAIILDAIGFGTPSPDLTGTAAIYENLRNICIGNLILTVAGQIPGAYVCVFTIDRLGRKPIQGMGFAVLAVLFVIMGFAYDKLNSTVGGTRFFVFLYCMCNFFSNFGPNSTVSLSPGEAFPTRYRSTAFGIAAASGKVGAVISQVGFSRLKDIGGEDHFVKHLLEIFALIMITGVFSTMLLPETMGWSLEDMSNEDQEDFIVGLAQAKYDERDA